MLVLTYWTQIIPVKGPNNAKQGLHIPVPGGVNEFSLNLSLNYTLKQYMNTEIIPVMWDGILTLILTLNPQPYFLKKNNKKNDIWRIFFLNNFQCVPIRMFICVFIAKKKFQKDLWKDG